MSSKIQGFAPHVGLEQIARYDGEQHNLPAQCEAQMTGERVRQRVDDLFNPQSLDQKMRNFIATHPTDPSILNPVRFNTLVQESAAALRTQATDQDHPLLHEACALLEHDQELRDLLANYRNSLAKA